jgi:AcrR family transcriptional regulator
MSPRLPAAERREQLLAVALSVFSAKGFHHASMNDVADAAGVTKPVLYQHFSSKRELYMALLDEAGERLTHLIVEATSEPTGPHDQVSLGVQAYFRWVAEDRDSFLLLFGDGGRRDEEFTEAIRQLEARMATAIAPLIRAEIDPDHQTILAHGIVGLAESTARRLVQQGDPFQPDVVAHQIAEMLWGGLRAVHR